MAEPGGAGAGGAAAGPAGPPRVLPWLVIYSVGRFAIAAALILLLWLAGLGSFPGLLFGLLLSMPVSYVLLRRSRERLTAALAADQARRQAPTAEPASREPAHDAALQTAS